jgi:Fic family protein
MTKIILWTLQKQPEGFTAFVPLPFPPQDFQLDPKLLKKADKATRLIGKLDGVTGRLPDAEFFLLMYLRKDAASSSQIEGTRATMIDAIEAEASLNTDMPTDVDDILHYIQALKYGMKRVREDDFPLTLRFIRELHKELMEAARATHFCDPGEFRRTQNWIGGTRPDNARFVPPPVHEMKRALGDLEDFIHADDIIPSIIKAGIIHSHFETIHPFLDWNGRTGRMLITFYLWKEGFLEQPVLFLSSFFKRHQELYYEKLSQYHNGEVVAWIDFFLDGVIEIAEEGIKTVSDITKLREENQIKIQSLGKRAAESSMPVLIQLYAQPIVNVATIQRWTGFTRKWASSVIERFIEIGVLEPKSEDKKYGQSYIYRKYVDIFSKNS